MISSRNKYPFLLRFRCFHYSSTSESRLPQIERSYRHIAILSPLRQYTISFAAILQPRRLALIFHIARHDAFFAAEGGRSVALFRLSYVSPSDIIAAGNARVLKRDGEGMHIDRKHEFPTFGCRPSAKVMIYIQSRQVKRPISATGSHLCAVAIFSRAFAHARGVLP